MGVPHPIPYQGSKRRLADAILRLLPSAQVHLVEPFAGSAAVSLAALHRGRAEAVTLNDTNGPLMELWRAIIVDPSGIADRYAQLWYAQQGRERDFYAEVRTQFNATHAPDCLLYLLARCVKASIRYNSRGEFNQSPDNRRLGMHPDTMRWHIQEASRLLRGRTTLRSDDYAAVLACADRDAVVYMDPPYQGVCGNRDPRYIAGVSFERFVASLADANARDISYLVSYDGSMGGRAYGQLLPDCLCLTRIQLDAGVSTQATLLGRSCRTEESLYVSPALRERLGGNLPHPQSRQQAQLALLGGAS